jgi:hypothetical protein
MRDFNLTDKDFNRVSFGSVIGMGTAIVAHTVDPLAELPYFQYLSGLGQRVILVASKDIPLLHIMNDVHELGLECYTDPDRHLITELKQQWALEPDSRSLTRLLRFQLLYDSGKEVGSWHQPVTEQWQQFFDDRDVVKRFIDKFGSFGVKWLQEQDRNDHLLWTGQNQMAYSYTHLAPNSEYDIFMKYYNLMPCVGLTAELNRL